MKLQLLNGTVIEITPEQWLKIQKLMQMANQPKAVNINGIAVRVSDIVGELIEQLPLKQKFDQLGLNMDWLQKAKAQAAKYNKH